jgi:hypothetical protein
MVQELRDRCPCTCNATVATTAPRPRDKTHRHRQVIRTILIAKGRARAVSPGYMLIFLGPGDVLHDSFHFRYGNVYISSSLQIFLLLRAYRLSYKGFTPVLSGKLNKPVSLLRVPSHRFLAPTRAFHLVHDATLRPTRSRRALDSEGSCKPPDLAQSLAWPSREVVASFAIMDALRLRLHRCLLRTEHYRRHFRTHGLLHDAPGATYSSLICECSPLHDMTRTNIHRALVPSSAMGQLTYP